MERVIGDSGSLRILSSRRPTSAAFFTCSNISMSRILAFSFLCSPAGLLSGRAFCMWGSGGSGTCSKWGAAGAITVFIREVIMFFNSGNFSINIWNWSLVILEASNASAHGYSFLIITRISRTRVSGIRRPGGGIESEADVLRKFIVDGCGTGGPRKGSTPVIGGMVFLSWSQGSAVTKSSFGVNRLSCVFTRFWAWIARNFNSATDVLSGLWNTDEDVFMCRGWTSGIPLRTKWRPEPCGDGRKYDFYMKQNEIYRN